MTAQPISPPSRELAIRHLWARATVALALVLLAVTAGPVGAGSPAPVANIPTAGFTLGATLGTLRVPVRISWPAATPGGADLRRYYLQQRADGGSWSGVALPAALAKSVTVMLRPGVLHQFRLRVVDEADIYSAWATAPPVWLDATQEHDLDLTYVGNWSRRSTTSAFGGGLAASSKAGVSAGLAFTATEFAWVSVRGTNRGRATVSATGLTNTVVDLYRSGTATRRIVHVGRWAQAGARTVGIHVEGTAGRPRVDVDVVLTLGPPPTAVLLGAGDIASCAWPTDEATADVVESLSGTVFTVGDSVYPDGTAAEFANCYEPSWGRFKQRTRPSPGNHDYHTSGAAPYFAYFGAVAGKPGQGWYAYDLGTWRIYALNSNCPEIGGCGTTSAQYAWLQADLAANQRRCVAAYWHHPRFSSGPHGPSSRMSSILQRLYDSGADIVVAGHDHLYERFAPMTPTGAADATRGIRHFTAGMGGAPLYDPQTTPAPNSQLIEADTHGVLKLNLNWSAYQWEFVAANGGTFEDEGSGACH